MTTFTHTGRREKVGHAFPKAGRVHALNATPGAWTAFASLCGEKVHAARTASEWGDPIPPECRTVQAGADAAKERFKRIDTAGPHSTKTIASRLDVLHHGRQLYEQLKNGETSVWVTIRLQRIGPYGAPLPADHSDCFALVGIVDNQK